MQSRADEKRVMIDIISIKQTASQDNIYWVPTTHQWADALTKIDLDLARRFLDFMSNVKVHVRASDG